MSNSVHVVSSRAATTTTQLLIFFVILIFLLCKNLIARNQGLTFLNNWLVRNINAFFFLLYKISMTKFRF